MPVSTLLLVLIVIAVAGYLLGRQRAFASAGGDSRKLHSLPSYYGWNVAMFALAPAVVLMLIWLAVQPGVIEGRVAAMIPDSAIPDGSSRSLVLGAVADAAHGTRALPAGAAPELSAAAESWTSQSRTGNIAMTIAVLIAALAGLAVTTARTNSQFRARNSVEAGIKVGLILCSLIAIATTAGIILSMVFETGNFFTKYSWTEFFFGTTWAPNFHGNSELGMLPLLWGTLYISVIALLVAVPVGLFAAIYMSEYAGSKFRSFAKPAIEMLAGIPTIVYGLFALLTVGPLIRDWIAQPMGLGTSGSSVMTAGLVMGVMIIPFVSSLSDDIINAVPQSLRDGSYGLGATKSETIRNVVIPAALPGVVGAILLAASRAIGETMIVVLGAGAAARLGLNPFEAMTTITVKIVSQLTGDTDFAAPETLVAFALGLTLFIITLALNVFALWIVRKYREQYE